MAIQPLSWLNGFSAFLLICTSWILGILILRFYLKEKRKQYLILFIFSAAIALGWTGITITFFSVVIYGYNLPWVKYVISYFSYSTVPVGSTAIIYFTFDVFGAPKFKKPLLVVYFSLMALYYIFLFATFSDAVVVSKVKKGQIYDDWLSPNSVVYYLLLIMVSITSLITLFGFYQFSKMTAGDLKKRAGFIILSSIIIGSCVLLDTVFLGSIFTQHEEYLFVVRFAMIPGVFCAFWGIRPSK
ncbi:MAG: hypothetical protein EU529_07890 [Promethearchaeota archaeon]|nr:MAG: hypothetical protein EU529_07890 [Candidatus Lokiarchaeota archaeon]